MCVQEVVPAPIPSSVRRFLLLADQLGPAGHHSARGSHTRNDFWLCPFHMLLLADGHADGAVRA